MNAWYYIDVWRKNVPGTWGTDPNFRKMDSYGPVRTSEENSRWWEQHFWVEHYPNNVVRRYLWNGTIWVLQPSIVALSGVSNETAAMAERK